MEETALDDLDRSIVTELEADGRRPFRDIARQLGISEATVRARVRRLEEAEVLKIVAFADPLRMGNSVMGLLFVHVEEEYYDKVVEALSGYAEVSYLSSVLGIADLCVQVVVRDQVELGKFIRSKVRVLTGVTDTATYIETEVHKLRFTSPPPGEAD